MQCFAKKWVAFAMVHVTLETGPIESYASTAMMSLMHSEYWMLFAAGGRCWIDRKAFVTYLKITLIFFQSNPSCNSFNVTSLDLS